ncbi:TPA: hypothetical protein NVL87_003624 [Enterobacter hormaechei subsp. xiangfangensis]|nr:hypothetical protein [Enterobacter hormaechei subsp. xiangfangensis]
MQLHRRQPEDKHPALHHKAFLPHQRVTTEDKAMEDEIEEFDEHPQDDMSQYQDYPYEYDY